MVDAKDPVLALYYSLSDTLRNRDPSPEQLEQNLISIVQLHTMLMAIVENTPNMSGTYAQMNYQTKLSSIYHQLKQVEPLIEVNFYKFRWKYLHYLMMWFGQITALMKTMGYIGEDVVLSTSDVLSSDMRLPPVDGDSGPSSDDEPENMAGDEIDG
ncbi:hypothetical protein DMB44_05355 [Thermoplasma sp. Kam2015]|uniref:hypothetical protein n=1 Tax=Thermoplasma sp. Kam2015 TaxID=2094122 RepID=UPI000D955964|nr:hypothetical protein [Thermoplasma sp. Kam2015]PYB68148.1 hypothetical protein DMB44_05355 [Thermoplasma sp. Kam2015]